MQTLKLFWQNFLRSHAWMPTFFMLLCVGHYYGVLPWFRDWEKEQVKQAGLLFFAMVFVEMTVYLLRQRNNDKRELERVNQENHELRKDYLLDRGLPQSSAEDKPYIH